MLVHTTAPLLFDPDQGTVVREPLGAGEGWWAGAPGAFWDDATARFYLAYRYRRPRGVEPDRGGELLIAESEDGIAFRDVWRVTKDRLDTPSMERACIRRLGPEHWALWVGYVDPQDKRWRIDSMEAEAPDRFDPERRRPALTAPPLGLEAVKDPWVLLDGSVYWMVVSLAERAPGAAGLADAELHYHADAYDTGRILAHSGLAVSVDGRRWQWLGKTLCCRRPGADWDGYSSRIGCILRTGSHYTAYYDGAIGVQNHYDERTGLALSFDLRGWTRLTPDGPVLSSPHSTGCCRYFDVVEAAGRRLVYYEFARPDGSHELRVWHSPP